MKKFIYSLIAISALYVISGCKSESGQCQAMAANLEALVKADAAFKKMLEKN